MNVVQVGEMALRDPKTGGFLPSIPLYARAEDSAGIAEPLAYDLRQLGKKVEEYRREAERLEAEEQARKEARKKAKAEARKKARKLPQIIPL